MTKNRVGDLSRSARIKDWVRCVRLPDIEIWQVSCPFQAFTLPEVGGLYQIRSHLCAAHLEGVLLVDLFNPGVILTVPFLSHTIHGEPFFEYRAFNFVRSA